MAVLTFAQLQDLFQALTVTMTGLPAAQVRDSYEANGMPGFILANDYAFIWISLVDDPWDKQRDVRYAGQDTLNGAELVTYTRVMQVQWTFYGPNSFDLADTVRHSILTYPIRSVLLASNVAPIPSIPPAINAPELHEGQWWQRSDLRVMVNVATSRSSTVPYLQSVVVKFSRGAAPTQTATTHGAADGTAMGAGIFSVITYSAKPVPPPYTGNAMGAGIFSAITY